MRTMQHSLALVLVLNLGSADRLGGQSRVEQNVVYGMYSGLALLLDVHHPARPNGYGVIFVAGSGWRAPLGYGAAGLKEAEDQLSVWVPPLLEAGYTVFSVNHRAAPRFIHPAAVEDLQRAVRFIRHNATRFGIDGKRLGGVGGSSGGHLIGLVGLIGAPGLSDDPDPVNREPATLDALVLRAAPSDLRKMNTPIGLVAVGGLMGRRFRRSAPDLKAFGAASPIVHVSAASPPVLLLHGDADDTVPFDQSVDLEAALKAANVPAKLVRVSGGQHGPTFRTDGQPHGDLPAILAEMVSWLDRYLRLKS